MINCRISNCRWLGSEEEIFHHVDLYHRQFIRECTSKTYFDFTLKDLQYETFILICSEGLYWFCQDLRPNTASNGIAFGIFHVGESKCQQFTLKLGLRRDGFCEHWGPYKTRKDYPAHERHNDVYELAFAYSQLEVLNERIPSRKLRLYFGDFDDSDDVEWPFAEGEMIALEKDELERLTCCVCFEFIRRNARFCENKHFVCLNCLEAMLKCRKLKCPTCRGLYLYDCSSDELERWLSLIKWPSEDDDSKTCS